MNHTHYQLAQDYLRETHAQAYRDHLARTLQPSFRQCLANLFTALAVRLGPTAKRQAQPVTPTF